MIKFLRELEAVGWKFFGLVMVLLLGPGIYLALRFTYDTATMGVRVTVGVVIAGISAAFVSFGVNELLHRRNVRRYEAGRKIERKANRKKKKKGK